MHLRLRPVRNAKIRPATINAEVPLFLLPALSPRSCILRLPFPDGLRIVHSVDPLFIAKRRCCAMLTAEKVREILKLRSHPIEGGYFVETYRSELALPASALPPAYRGKRFAATAIFYMLTPDAFSALHKLPGDEMFHFYLGDPVETLLLRVDGSSSTVRLGQDISSGMLLQHVVPGGVWQGSRLVPGGSFALLGTTMSPGFDYADYEAGQRDALLARFPQHRDRILSLTR